MVISYLKRDVSYIPVSAGVSYVMYNTSDDTQ